MIQRVFKRDNTSAVRNMSVIYGFISLACDRKRWEGCVGGGWGGGGEGSDANPPWDLTRELLIRLLNHSAVSSLPTSYFLFVFISMAEI